MKIDRVNYVNRLNRVVDETLCSETYKCCTYPKCNSDQNCDVKDFLRNFQVME